MDEMSLCHVLPGYPEVEVVKNGEDLPVKQGNIQKYLEVNDKHILKYFNLIISIFQSNNIYFKYYKNAVIHKTEMPTDSNMKCISLSVIVHQ